MFGNLYNSYFENFIPTYVFQTPVFPTTFAALESTIKALALERDVDIVGESLKGFTPDQAYELASEALLTGNMSPWRERGVAVM